MNTLSKKDPNSIHEHNVLREEKVKFFVKRLLSYIDFGVSLKVGFKEVIRDDQFISIYPELAKHIETVIGKETNVNFPNNKILEEIFTFKDFSYYFKSIVINSSSNGDIRTGLRAALSTAAFEQQLILSNNFK